MGHKVTYLDQEPSKPDSSDKLLEYTHVGALIQATLNNRGVSQTQCANDLGVTQVAINQICRKKRELSPRMALLFERYLGISANELLVFQNEQKLAKARKKLEENGRLIRVRPLRGG